MRHDIKLTFFVFVSVFYTYFLPAKYRNVVHLANDKISDTKAMDNSHDS